MLSHKNGVILISSTRVGWTGKTKLCITVKDIYNCRYECKERKYKQQLKVYGPWILGTTRVDISSCLLCPTKFGIGKT